MVTINVHEANPEKSYAQIHMFPSNSDRLQTSYTVAVGLGLGLSLGLLKHTSKQIATTIRNFVSILL
jgi:hypothetical protein